MNGHIPNIVKPYPDEILFSWIGRLANANGLSLEVFFKTYFGEKSVIKEKLIPVDIRKGFLDFCEALNCNMDNMDLYFQMSTAQFELSCRIFTPDDRPDYADPSRIAAGVYSERADERPVQAAVPYFQKSREPADRHPEPDLDACADCGDRDFALYHRHPGIDRFR